MPNTTVTTTYHITAMCVVDCAENYTRPIGLDYQINCGASPYRWSRDCRDGYGYWSEEYALKALRNAVRYGYGFKGIIKSSIMLVKRATTVITDVVDEALEIFHAEDKEKAFRESRWS
jgi:hypothetical protein